MAQYFSAFADAKTTRPASAATPKPPSLTHASTTIARKHAGYASCIAR